LRRFAPAAVPQRERGGEAVGDGGILIGQDVEQDVEHVAGNGTRELTGIVWRLCHAVMSQCPGLARTVKRKTRAALQALAGGMVRNVRMLMSSCDFAGPANEIFKPVDGL
jgi:hypothetical protein